MALLNISNMWKKILVVLFYQVQAELWVKRSRQPVEIHVLLSIQTTSLSLINAVINEMKPLVETITEGTKRHLREVFSQEEGMGS